MCGVTPRLLTREWLWSRVAVLAVALRARSHGGRLLICELDSAREAKHGLARRWCAVHDQSPALPLAFDLMLGFDRHYMGTRTVYRTGAKPVLTPYQQAQQEKVEQHQRARASNRSSPRLPAFVRTPSGGAAVAAAAYPTGVDDRVGDEPDPVEAEHDQLSEGPTTADKDSEAWLDRVSAREPETDGARAFETEGFLERRRRRRLERAVERARVRSDD